VTNVRGAGGEAKGSELKPAYGPVRRVPVRRDLLPFDLAISVERELAHPFTSFTFGKNDCLNLLNRVQIEDAAGRARLSDLTPPEIAKVIAKEGDQISPRRTPRTDSWRQKRQGDLTAVLDARPADVFLCSYASSII
jgi:hypothetical protein